VSRRRYDPLDVRFGLDPHPTGRDRMRALKRWRADPDAVPGAAVAGVPVTPAQVDWDLVPASYHSLSGPTQPRAAREAAGRVSRLFALREATDDRIARLATALGLSRSQVVARAVDELAARVGDGEA
jgi:hypothetical protein